MIVDGFCRRGVLLSRRAARRTPRSQHPVLEVAAGFGSHDRALEGEHSARGSAADHLRDHRCHATDHAAAEHRRPADERSERRDADTAAVVSMPLVLLYGLVVLALWHAPIYGWLLLVSGWARRAAFLWAVLPLVAICILEKIAFNTSYFASMLKLPFDRAFVRRPSPQGAHGTIDSADTTHAGKLPEHAGSLDRPGIRRGVSCRSGPAAPLSRTDLIRRRSRGGCAS